MSEVSVNIRGRDDGLGNQLDSLRQKARELGKDVEALNKLSDLTPTERKMAVNRTGEDTLRAQQERVRQEYANLRASNSDDYQEMLGLRNSGGISDKEFGNYQDRFSAEQGLLNDQESQELLALEREMNEHLREIAAAMTTQDKIDRERRQRDNAEFRGNGLTGQLLEENQQLRREQFGATSEDEVAALQARIDSNNSRISEMRRPGGRGGGSDGNGFEEFGMAAGAAGSGDLMGTVGGGLRGMGKMTGMAKAFTITGLVAILMKEILGHGDKLRESLAPVSGMRGGYGTGSQFNDALRSKFGIDGRFDFGAIGMDNEEVAAAMRDKAVSSGMAGKDLQKRTFDDLAFSKAFGADAGMFSEFERFTKGQEDATQIAMDVLNVLTSIDRSSLKETDLSTLTEKLQAQQTIMSIQRSKRDLVNNDDSLKLLSAFESIGLSRKGERAGGFMSQTIEGLGEGGSDNAMMLKLEAARRSRPDLANNPAALRRLVKFNSDDPEYMSEFFKMAGTMTGGNDMAMDDLLMTFFNPESEADLEIYKKAMKGGNFQEMLKGKGLQGMKTRKSTLDRDTMISDAESGVGSVTELLKDFNNRTQGMADTLSSLLKDIIVGNSVSVSILEDKSKKQPNRASNIPSNKVKTGN